MSTNPPPVLRVLVVEDDALVSMGLKSQLERLGHAVVDQAANAAEAAAAYADHHPDLVLLDIKLGEDDGLVLAERLMRDRRTPMIIISAYSDPQLVQRAAAAGVFGYLVKPVAAPGLNAQIEIALRRFAEQERLIQEKEALAQSLETRKLVERAKGILMRRQNLAEPDAHRRLQLEAQKRRISAGDMARKIIESEELLGGG